MADTAAKIPMLDPGTSSVPAFQQPATCKQIRHHHIRQQKSGIHSIRMSFTGFALAARQV